MDSAAEDPKITLERIKAGSAREQGALEVAKESLRVVTSFLDVMKSNQQLQAKRVEWESRVAEAQKNVDKAEVELKREAQVTAQHRVNADRYLEALRPLVDAFDDIMKEMSDPAIDAESRKEYRKELLNFGQLIVQLKA